MNGNTAGLGRAVFGPAGMCDSASGAGIKTTEKLLEYLSRRGADLFEYQCGRGVNIGEEKARLLRKKANEQNIILTLHAPYYISLASAEEQKRDNSVNYILQSARAADWLGAERIVVHPGGIGKYTRDQAFDIACETLEKAVAALEEENLGHITVCPEVMGKINQLGSLSEVLDFCRRFEKMLPCVDFGHLNSRLQGKMDYRETLDEIFGALGEERAKRIHIHFSKIEYTAGGEKQHLTFADDKYGPEFEPLMEEIAKRGMTPYVVCESSGTQTDDSLTMKEYYGKIKNG